MTKKLFLVEVTCFGYVLADTAEEASHYAQDIVADTPTDERADTEEVRSPCQLMGGWDRDCLVYGTKDDMTLSQAMDEQGLVESTEKSWPGPTVRVPAQVPAYVEMPPLGSDGA